MVWCVAAVGAACVTIAIERDVDASNAARVDAARKRAGIVVPEAGGRMGPVGRANGRDWWNRAGGSDKMTAGGSING